METELTALEFERLVEDAIASVPEPLAGFMSNVGVVIDEQAPPWQSVLGLYQGIPLTRRGTNYTGALPDKITIFRQPIERVYGTDPERLRDGVRRVVVHEIAHHFGISDERLRELGAY
ncbi:MAG TPA: metallopeptidase family protein [Gaiellaceae bacterium]|nr:metallopeptidase family protein [Gaiellaceae bacterium]